jgi:nucleotide-binding universal stress UspA family protein
MFTRILVPLDGSDRALQAVPVAARIAREAHGTVILLQATELSSNILTEGKYPSQMYPDDLAEEGRALAANYLYNMSKMPVLADVKVEIRVEFGDAAQSILEAVEPLDVDLIVMCSHGYSGFKSWALGSVVRKIIPHSSVPILALRDGGPTLAAKPIYALVALDGSPLSEEALTPVTQLLAALAPSAHKTLHLIRVVELPPTYGRPGLYAHADQMREEAKRQSQAYLADVAERLGKGGIPDLTVTTSVAVNVDVAEALALVAQQELLAGGHFDLVAMATHGRSGMQRLLMGSITEHVMNATNLPVLVVHPAGQSRETHVSDEQQVEATH